MIDEQQINLMLAQGLQSLNLAHLSTSLSAYLVLLNKWNAAYNLTAIRETDGMIGKHLLDSLAILPWLQGKRIIDVGTGPGLPGIPLALAKPEVNFVLLDSNGKKTRFLNEVKRQLSLKNVEIVQIRAEKYHPTPGFDTVLSRAFSSLGQMVQWTQHLIADQGIWLAMKGRFPDAELHDIKQKCAVKSYSVAGVDGERCCVIIENTTKE